MTFLGRVLLSCIWQTKANTYKVEHEDIEAETVQIRKEAQESLEQNFTPSLARRLSRQFIEQTRQSLPRSSSISCEKYYQSPTRENLSLIDTAEGIKRHSSSTTSDQTEYRSRSADRNIRRTNSLLEAGNKADKLDYRFSRRSISLFDDDDNLLPLPRQVMTLGRKYKEIGRSNSGNTWRDTFSVHRTDKIQEESLEDTSQLPKDVLNNTDNNLDAGSVSECTSVSICNSNTNLVDTTSSISIKSRDTSPADSSSNIIDSGKPSYRMDSSKNFENRLLAAENLIKESKLKNLGPSKFDPNLNSNYKETDKCDKESLSSISDAPNMTISKRRSCIPSLRLRSGSLTRDPCIDSDRRKSFAGSQGTLSNIRALSPEKSILSKFFRGGSSKESDSKDKSQKPKQHRISRFLRPDFFDTPREESRYVKEKEAQKAAENERRKSRFMKKKSENKSAECKQETKPEKELKNEMNSLKKDKSDISSDDKSNKEDNTKLKFERQSSRNSFLHSLEKKLEKFRVTDETPKSSSNGGLLIDQKVRALRENSAPPSDSLFTESNLIKRAISVEDMSSKENSLNSRKSRVSSVLGLFKSSDVKQNSNAIKSQSTIMSKLKKSPPKLVKTDASSTNEDTSSTSKIPMKMVKNDSRLIKKPTEGKKPLDNSITESKKSQYKDKVKEKDTNSKERKMSNEKLLKTSGEDESQIDKSSPTEISVDKEIVKKTNSGKKEDDPKLISNPPETRKVMDNGAAEGNISKREKKVIKTKKNVGSVKKIGTGVTKAEKEENGDKKTSKISKLKEPVQKEEAEGTKKKKIVRVVKKVVKKSSENSDNKSEEKAKVLKSIVKGNTSPKKEKSPEAPAINADYSNERNSDLQNSTKFTTSDSSIQETRTKLKGNLSSVDAISNKSELMASGNNSSKSPDCIQINATDSDVTQTKHTDTRGNRGSLKLDLSKIPQHTFRNTTPKKESPKCELIKPNVNVLSQSPKINETNADISSEKFLDSLSKMTHHATITGNKIIIDKPLRAKDVAELKKEVNECARLIENQIELHNDIVPSNEDIAVRKEDEINAKLHTPLNNIDKTEPVNEKDIFKDTTQSTNMNTYADEVTSPADEPDSFDSWSICSADMNHTRADLSSPTSPSYSLFSRGDQGESVIDRIRRRSFYLRFNDRRRPSLTVPPPGITLPSSTLPRKYSSSNSRDRDRSKLNSYPLSNKKLMQRSYSLHNEDIPSYRKSPIDKEKYTDLVSYNTEVKTPTEHYSTFSHSTYDPLRKYLRSPTLELSTAHKRYHSTDFSMDDELGAYRNSSLNSILNNNPVEFYGSRNSSMLPRKYGSTITSTEPKTVEYYEELLSPSNPEYLTVRKSPLSNEYLNRSENGYYNINSIKSKTCIAKTKTESTEEINKELEEQGRITSQCNSESKDMPSTSSDLQSIIHNTE